MLPEKIAILGVGLLGGSLGLAAKEAINGCAINGYGHRPATLAAAVKRGAIDAAFERPEEAVQGCDLVVLATPVGIFDQLLSRIAPALARGAVVTDVGSTKRRVVESGERLLPKGEFFVGSHPIAGSEKRGVEVARADLFRGALCIVTPTPRTDAGALAMVEEFWRVLGMRVRRMEAGEHDRILGEVSHLPHAVAAALVAVQSERGLEVCGKGFLDATRIAAGDGELWRDIFLDNRENFRDGIVAVRAELDRLIQLLDKQDGKLLKEWLDAAAARRRGMEK